MGVVKDIGKKIKAKAKQAQGDYNIKGGRVVSGSLQKLKGKLDEAEADIKLKARREKAKEDVDESGDDYII